MPILLGLFRTLIALAISLPAAVLGLAVMLVGGTLGALQIPAVQSLVTKQVNAILAPDGDAEPGIALVGLSGTLPFDVRLERLTMRDEQGLWLEVEEARLAWRPLSLLERELEIVELSAQRVALPRTPVSEPSPPSDPVPLAEQLDLPTLPIAVTVRELAVPRFELGEPVVGQAATLSLTGELAAPEGKRAETNLIVRRLDGPETALDLEAAYDLAERTLNLDLTFKEAPGGLVASLAGLPGEAPIALSLAGEGPISAWQGKLGLSGAMGAADLALRLGIDDSEESVALGLDGTVSPELAALGLGDPAIERALGESVGLGLDAKLVLEERLDVSRLEVEVAALSLSGTAGLDLAGETVAADLTARLKDAGAVQAFVPEVSLATAEVRLRAEGALAQPDLDVELATSDLRASDLSVGQLHANVRFEPAKPLEEGIAGALAVTASADGLDWPGLGNGDGPLAETATLDLAAEVDVERQSLTLDRLALDAGPLVATGSGSLDKGGETADLELEASLNDLSIVSAVAGMPLSGGLSLDVTARGEGSEGSPAQRLRAEVKVRGDGLGLDLGGAEDLVGTDPSVTATALYSDAGGLDVESLAVEVAAGELRANAKLPADFSSVTAAYDLRVSDLGAASGLAGMPLAGSLRLEGTAEGPVEDPAVAGLLTVENLLVEGIEAQRLALDYRVESPASAPQGRISLNGETSVGPVAMSAVAAQRDGRIHVDPLTLKVAGLEAEGQLAMPLSGPPLSGRVTARSGDLGPLLAIAGEKGSGTLALDLQLQESQGRQQASFDLGLGRVVYRPAGGDPIALGKLAVTGTAGDLLGTPSLDAQVRASDLEAPPASIESLALTAQGSLEELAFTLDTKGELTIAGITDDPELPERKPVTVAAAGTLGLPAGGVEVQLDRLNVRAVGETIGLERPTRIALAGERIEVDNLALAIGRGGRITADGALDPARTSMDVEIQDLPLSLADLADPDLDLSGTLDLSASAQGNGRSPRLQATLTATGVGDAARTGVPPLDLEAKLEGSDGQMEIALELGGFSQTSTTASVTLPARLSLAPTQAFVLDQDGPLSGRVDWEGNLAEVWPLVPIEGQQLAGPAVIHVTLGGTVADPAPEGSISIQGGAYQNYEIGTILRDLQLALDFNPGRIDVERLSASDGAKGTIEVSGGASTDPETGFPFEVALKVNDFLLVRRDDVTAQTDIDLKASGDLTAMTVEGTIAPDAIEVRLIDQLPPNVVELDVEVKGEPLPPVDPNGNGQESDIQLDITVDAPRKIYVRGRGLESEWGGKLSITGSASAPKIVGSLSPIRGRFTLVGQTLELDPNSQVIFDGGRNPEPRLDITATSERDELLIMVRVTGRASSPDLKLTSTPERPQDEIMAQLLFGKNSGQLTAGEAVQVASAIAQLTSGGPGALDFARNLLGVDTLDVEGIGEDTEEGPTVSAGKYLTDDVFVAVEQGATAGSSAVRVEVELTDNISVESGVDAVGDTSVGMNFRWDY